jgi:hypothetical protein
MSDWKSANVMEVNSWLTAIWENRGATMRLVGEPPVVTDGDDLF